MNTAERRLSDWLHQSTPEPPRTLTVEDIQAWSPPPGRGDRRRTLGRNWAPALTVVSVLAVLAVVAAGLSAHHSPPAVPSSSTPAGTDAPSPATNHSATAPANAADLRLVGANGTSAWKVTPTNVVVSTDAGAHWSDVALPAGVTPASITAIASAPGGGLWLTEAHPLTIDLYHRRNASTDWLHTTLTATKPAGLNLGGASPDVSITLQPNQVITVIGTWGLTSSSAFVAAFYSTDDGTTFVQPATNVGSYWKSLIFRTPHRGILVGGVSTVSNRVYRTTDGGASWSPVTIPGLGSGQAFFGAPAIDGAAIELPVILTRDNGDQQVSIYRSTDDGATFTAPSGPPLTIPAAISAGQAGVAILGQTVWVPAQGRIYQSGDGGQTWTTVASPGTPYLINLIDASHATAVASDSACANGNSDCTYLVSTTDGGRHWRAI